MTTEQLILKKLGIQRKSALFILENEALCQRIKKEDVIPLTDFVKKYKVSIPYVQRLARLGIISRFSNVNTKGSKQFIFENEVKEYITTTVYHGGYNARLNNVIELYLRVVKSNLTEREYDIISTFLLGGMNREELSEKFMVSHVRIAQIYTKAYRRITLNSRIKDFNNIQEKRDILLWEVEYLKKQKDRYTKYLREHQLPIHDSKLAILYKNLYDCDISVRALNCCKAVDIDTVGDLIELSKYDIMKFRNFGKKSLEELTDFLHYHNLSWRK